MKPTTNSFGSSSAALDSKADRSAHSVDDQYEDAEKNYQPKSLKFWTIIVATYLSLFLVGLDRSIIATAIPKITDEFNSIEDIGYVYFSNPHSLSMCCMLFPFPIGCNIKTDSEFLVLEYFHQFEMLIAISLGGMGVPTCWLPLAYFQSAGASTDFTQQSGPLLASL